MQFKFPMESIEDVFEAINSVLTHNMPHHMIRKILRVKDNSPLTVNGYGLSYVLKVARKTGVVSVVNPDRPRGHSYLYARGNQIVHESTAPEAASNIIQMKPIAAEPTDKEEKLALYEAIIHSKRVRVDELISRLAIAKNVLASSIEMVAAALASEREARAQLKEIEKEIDDFDPISSTMSAPPQIAPIEAEPSEEIPESPYRSLMIGNNFLDWWLRTAIAGQLAENNLNPINPEYRPWTDIQYQVKMEAISLDVDRTLVRGQAFNTFSPKQFVELAFPAAMKVEEKLKLLHGDKYNFTSFYRKHQEFIQNNKEEHV